MTSWGDYCIFCFVLYFFTCGDLLIYDKKGSRLLIFVCLLSFFASELTIVQSCRDGSSCVKPYHAADKVSCSRTQHSDSVIAGITLETKFKVNIHKTATSCDLLLQILMEDIHSWHNGCVYCVNDSKGLAHYYNFGVKSQSKIYI